MTDIQDITTKPVVKTLEQFKKESDLNSLYLGSIVKMLNGTKEEPYKVYQDIRNIIGDWIANLSLIEDDLDYEPEMHPNISYQKMMMELEKGKESLDKGIETLITELDSFQKDPLNYQANPNLFEIKESFNS